MSVPSTVCAWRACAACWACTRAEPSLRVTHLISILWRLADYCAQEEAEAKQRELEAANTALLQVKRVHACARTYTQFLLLIDFGTAAFDLLYLIYSYLIYFARKRSFSLFVFVSLPPLSQCVCVCVRQCVSALVGVCVCVCVCGKRSRQGRRWMRIVIQHTANSSLTLVRLHLIIFDFAFCFLNLFVFI